MHKFPQNKHMHYFLPFKCHVSRQIQTSHLCTLQKLNSAMSNETNSVPYDGRLYGINDFPQCQRKQQICDY